MINFFIPQAKRNSHRKNELNYKSEEIQSSGAWFLNASLPILSKLNLFETNAAVIKLKDLP